jgi:two-component system sensor histidine kinase PhoQ
MALLLLAAQWVILRWGLLPLRRVADDLGRLEKGAQQQLSGRYPDELTGLTDNLNAVLRQERVQRKRYRDALADLAHSLKTPLALLRGTLREANADAGLRKALDEQVDRMDRIVAYHLRRAEAAGRAALGSPVLLQPIAARIVRALGKVYSDKNVSVSLEIASELQFRGDEGDLTELLGNVLDNAFKWCRGRVRIGAYADASGLVLKIEDDGPGISQEDSERVLQRGARADQSLPGQGIGLAVSRDIVEAYEGRIVLGRSDLGGAAVTLALPAPGVVRP